jgi:uncharacterized membrane protein
MAGVLPEKVRQRVTKLGFAAPERVWRKTVLYPLIKQAIQDERLRPFILPDKATDYLEYLNQYDLGDYAAWDWLNLSLWIKTFDVS